MKGKVMFILVLMFLGTMPGLYQPINADSDESSVPAPEFVSVSPDNENSFLYQVNDTITITYKTSRFNVDGMVLLGQGSNLTAEITDNNVKNFTLVDSLRDKSTYEIELNVTSYTYFFAATWYNSMTNFTIEELDFEDNALGHQLWLKDEQQYPIFDGIAGATDQTNNEFYAPLGSNVTIVYEVNGFESNDTQVTLSFANSTEKVFSGMLNVSNQFEMVLTNFENNISRFEYNYTISQRLVFFSAFNEYGFERSDGTTPISYSINTGFNFSTSFTEKFNEYTNYDEIIFNMTAFNETVDDEFFYRIRVFENNTSEDPINDWTDNSINATALIFPTELVNNTLNYNSTKSTYNVNLGKFNIDQKIELQIYVNYLSESYNESTPYTIVINDGMPIFNLVSRNETQTNRNEATLFFNFDTLRGSILEASIASNFTSKVDIKGRVNFTISLENGSLIIEGLQMVIFNITSQFEVVNSTTTINQTRFLQNVSRIIQVFYFVDTTAPVIQLVTPIVNIQADSTGFVEFSFTALDAGEHDTGILYVTVDWGNGVAINATEFASSATVSWQYKRSGTYRIQINATDKVGNKFSLPTFEIVVELPTEGKSNNRDTPVPTLPIVFGILGSLLIMNIRRKKLDLK